MPLRNLRRPITEHYDPKQRIVGGVVLFLLMLLIYSLLKLLLGFSSVPEGRFDIGDPLTAEILNTTGDSNTRATLRSDNATSTSPIQYRLPQGFVFLDLNGKPMQEEVYQTAAVQSTSSAYTTSPGEEKWYVQAASFKDETLAQSLVKQIKDNNIAAEVHIIQSSNGWYAVRLPPQSEQGMAKQQHRQLRNLLKINGIIRKIP